MERARSHKVSLPFIVIIILVAMSFGLLTACTSVGQEGRNNENKKTNINSPSGYTGDTAKEDVQEVTILADEEQPSEEEELLEEEKPLEQEKLLEEEQQLEPGVIVKKDNLPEGFVYLDEYVPSGKYVMGYYGEQNFVGVSIDGYNAPLAIATETAAAALQAVSAAAEKQGYILVIYDAYRPQKAVEHFARWSADESDIAMKEVFYPNEDKAAFFQKGYLARKSGHSRGSTFDLTLAYADTGEELDMGSPVDMLDRISRFDTGEITKEQSANRQLLKQLMVEHGFKPYSKEWWHYTLQKEPFPNQYFDFDIE